MIIKNKGSTGSDLSLIVDNAIVKDRGNGFKVVAQANLACTGTK